MVTHKEAFGYCTDRILLLLGPIETPYPFLLADVPKHAALLTEYAARPPRERIIRLTTISPDMLVAYIKFHCCCTAVLNQPSSSSTL
jgi:hypothetical protein